MNKPNIEPHKYCIIVMSCDGYSDIWPYFSECWHRFWPDCPFDTYLISEQLEFKDSKIKNIQIGRKVGWSDMLIEVLNRLPFENIIYMQEDYLLKGIINNESVIQKLKAFEEYNAAYLRLTPWPSPKKNNLAPDLGSIEKGEPYRTSLQCAIWNVSQIKLLLSAGENGWEFENHSITRSDNLKQPFLGFYDSEATYTNLNTRAYPIDYFATGVLNGKWMKECIKLFKSKGIRIDTRDRGILNRWDYFYYQFNKEASNTALSWINRNIFRKRYYHNLQFYFLRLIGSI